MNSDAPRPAAAWAAGFLLFGLACLVFIGSATVLWLRFGSLPWIGARAAGR